MRKFFLILLVAGFVIGMSQQVDAQTYMTRTTLSAAINNSQATITVASGTNFSAGQFVWVNGEAMQISSVSGTSIRVIRGILIAGLDRRLDLFDKGTDAAAPTDVGCGLAFITPDPLFCG